MKGLQLSFLALTFCSLLAGQYSEPIQYQAIIRDLKGEVVVSKDVSLKISILTENISGPVIYSEVHKVATDQSGLVSITIGNGKEDSGNFANIEWREGNYFLKVEVDLAGADAYYETGTVQLLVIPYEQTAESDTESSPLFEEEEFLIVRKYMGSFVDYRQSGFETTGGPNIIWIKTTLDNIYGKISAYGRKCNFSVGDNLYLKRTYYSPGGVVGYWKYIIENDSSVYYEVSEFQHDKKVFVETWFK